MLRYDAYDTFHNHPKYYLECAKRYLKDNNIQVDLDDIHVHVIHAHELVDDYTNNNMIRISTKKGDFVADVPHPARGDYIEYIKNELESLLIMCECNAPDNFNIDDIPDIIIQLMKDIQQKDIQKGIKFKECREQ